MNEGSRKAVIAACAASAWIAATKFVGFFLTGATSMLAEGVHSVADTGNQLLLLVGKCSGAASGDESWWDFIRHSKHAELPVVLLEDLGALVGLLRGRPSVADVALYIP